MAVPRFVRYAGKGYVGQYIHLGRQDRRDGGVRRRRRRRSPTRDEFATLVKEIAMQIAAASPTYVSRDACRPTCSRRRRRIYRAQMENSGKPANVIEKIVEGKLGSYYKQVVLPDQASIRDPKHDGARRDRGGQRKRSARRSR